MDADLCGIACAVEDDFSVSCGLGRGDIYLDSLRVSGRNQSVGGGSRRSQGNPAGICSAGIDLPGPVGRNAEGLVPPLLIAREGILRDSQYGNDRLLGDGDTSDPFVAVVEVDECRTTDKGYIGRNFNHDGNILLPLIDRRCDPVGIGGHGPRKVGSNRDRNGRPVATELELGGICNESDVHS